MKKRLQTLRNEEGLTLVELLAVIVILAIVSVIAFVMISQVIENSKKDAAVANALQMINSAKLYEANGMFTDPSEKISDIASAGFIGDIIDPFSKTKYTPVDTDVVLKDASSGVYSVVLGGNAGSKCAIPETTELVLVDKGREVCADVSGP